MSDLGRRILEKNAAISVRTIRFKLYTKSACNVLELKYLPSNWIKIVLKGVASVGTSTAGPLLEKHDMI
jgi:hypothetical protein